MKVAALLALLAALPAHAGGPVSPEQARTNVVKAMGLPAEVERGARTGDLQRFLSGLSQQQKEAALRSLQAKGGELGDDPSTLAVVGQAYAGLGKVKEARQAAQQILRERPNDPEAGRLMMWVNAQDKLAGREGGGGPGAPGGARVSPAGAGQSPMNALEQRISGLFRRGNNSETFRTTMATAGGRQSVGMAELQAAGISFQRARPGQTDAVTVEKQGTGFTIYVREDALNSGGDTQARGAAHVVNGVEQANTRKEYPTIGGAIIMVRGWIAGAKTHRELAPDDIDRRPTAQPDRDLMASRKLLDLKTNSYDPDTESYGGDKESETMQLLNSLANAYGMDAIFSRFLTMTKRVN